MGTNYRQSPATAQVLNTLTGINADSTIVVLVTHDARVAARAFRVLVLDDGRIVAARRLGPWQSDADAHRLHTVTELLAQHGVEASTGPCCCLRDEIVGSLPPDAGHVLVTRGPVALARARQPGMIRWLLELRE